MLLGIDFVAEDTAAREGFCDMELFSSRPANKSVAASAGVTADPLAVVLALDVDAVSDAKLVGIAICSALKHHHHHYHYSYMCMTI